MSTSVRAGPLRRAGGALLPVRVFLVAAAARLLIRLPFPVLERLLEPHTAPAPVDGAARERVAACVERVLRTGRPWVSAGCVTRSITRYYFLRRAGLELRLCFGATLGTNGAVAGHCWLEHRGEPILEEADPRPAYAVMHRIPAAPRR
jgi:hypothetical protein